MSKQDAKQVVIQFNECINNRHLAGLAELLSEDHVFIDSSGARERGKEAMIAGWKSFFDRYPDYRNHFQTMQTRGNLVLIAGYSTCSVDALDGPALWSAKVQDGRIAEWRVFLDTAENRKQLGL